MFPTSWSRKFPVSKKRQTLGNESRMQYPQRHFQGQKLIIYGLDTWLAIWFNNGPAGNLNLNKTNWCQNSDTDPLWRKKKNYIDNSFVKGEWCIGGDMYTFIKSDYCLRNDPCMVKSLINCFCPLFIWFFWSLPLGISYQYFGMLKSDDCKLATIITCYRSVSYFYPTVGPS